MRQSCSTMVALIARIFGTERYVKMLGMLRFAALVFAVGTLSQCAGGDMVESGPVGLVLPLGGAALSAEQVEERTHTTSDGESVSERVVSNIYRDSAGRMRVEWRVENGGKSARLASLLDPVSGSAYMILIEAKRALRLGGPDPGSFNFGFPAIGRVLPGHKWRTKNEPLGDRVIEGIKVAGSRTTRTSEDEPPLTALHEEWLSVSLHLTVLVEASGPGWKHTAKLQNIDQHEPDPALFVIPADYAIQ